MSKKNSKMDTKVYKGVQIQLAEKSRSKYKNRRSYVYNKSFASFDEACRYVELREEYPKDTIICQKRYPLHCNGVEICKYVPDFDYVNNGIWITEDVKGNLTDTYKLKKKMFLAEYIKDNPHRQFIESRKKRSLGFNITAYNGIE